MLHVTLSSYIITQSINYSDLTVHQICLCRIVIIFKSILFLQTLMGYTICSVYV